jgi:dihydrofolate reductase
MSNVFTGAAVSLDGFVAGPAESGFEYLFDWYNNGDLATASANPDVSFRFTQENYDFWQSLLQRVGALVVGRRLFDITNGWGGVHPIGVPVVVLTHRPLDPPSDSFTIVHGGIHEAVKTARRLAGDKDVNVTAGQMGSQAIEAGLVDELWLGLVPVLLGEGTRYFSGLTAEPRPWREPEVISGRGVTHLRYHRGDYRG